MPKTSIPAALRSEVATRAQERCEYCQLPEKFGFTPYEVDHVIAQWGRGTGRIQDSPLHSISGLIPVKFAIGQHLPLGPTLPARPDR